MKITVVLAIVVIGLNLFAATTAARASAASNAQVRQTALASFTEINGDLQTAVACGGCPTALAIVSNDAKRCMNTLISVQGSTARGEAGRLQAYQACLHEGKAMIALMAVTANPGGGDAVVVKAEWRRAHAVSVKAARLLGFRVVL